MTKTPEQKEWAKRAREFNEAFHKPIDETKCEDCRKNPRVIQHSGQGFSIWLCWGCHNKRQSRPIKSKKYEK